MPGKPRNSRPYLRGKRGKYYCWIEGRSRSLGTDRPRVAEARYQEMLLEWRKGREREGREEAPPPPTVRECLDAYLESCRGMRTRHGYEARAAAFADFRAATGTGELPWSELEPGAVDRWLAGHPEWTPSTRRTRINHLMAAFNFCLRRRRIDSNPLKGVDRPQFRRRKHMIGPADQATLLDAASGPFRSILLALIGTGARPSELCRATVADYRDGRIVLAEHKTDSGGEDRVIYLPASVREEVERLIGVRTEGPIWRNARGTAWSPGVLYLRFWRFRKKHPEMGEGVFPYAFRAAFVTRGIKRGIDLVTLSDLVGHKDVDMIKRHYANLDQEHYGEALKKINEEPPGSSST